VSVRVGQREEELLVPLKEDDGLKSNLVTSGVSGEGLKLDQTTPTFGWRDIIGNVEPKASGAGSPSRSVYFGSIGQYSFALNDVSDFQFHIPHDYVPGTDLYFHVHWSHTDAVSISGTVAFSVFYSNAKGHNQADFGAEKTQDISYAVVDLTTTPQYRHRIDEIIISGASATATLIDRDDFEVDGLLLATLKMKTLPTFGGTGKIFIHTCDIHYQSTSVATKNKAPGFYT
jgi:hypothetical protein